MFRRAPEFLSAAALVAGLPAQEAASQPATRVPSSRTLVTEVRDVLGAPIPGARLELRSRLDGSLLRAGTSDGSGLCIVPGIPDDQPTSLLVSASGFAQQRVPIDAPRDFFWERAHEIELQQASRIRGRVRAADGTPLAGATIGAVGHPASATTDAAGSYELGGAPLGRLQLFATKPGHAPQTLIVDAVPETSSDFTLSPAGPERELSITVEPKLFRQLGGRCSVHVEFLGTSALSTDLRCDEKGVARVANAGAGRLDAYLVAADPDLVVDPVCAYLPQDGEKRLELGRATLPTSHEVAGRLVDAGGQGLPRTTMWIGHGDGRETRVVTDDAGAFRGLLAVMPQRRVFARITSGSHVLDRESRRGIEPDARGSITLQAVAACAVRGVVTDEHKNPLPYTRVQLVPCEETGGYPAQGVTTRADAEGKFEFERLITTPKEFLVLARRGELAGTVSGIALDTPGSRESVTVVVEPVGSVTGRLLRGGGEPAANEEVRIARSGPRHDLPFTSVRTDREGRFCARGLPQGKYAVYVPPFLRDRVPGMALVVDGPKAQSLGAITLDTTK